MLISTARRSSHRSPHCHQEHPKEIHDETDRRPLTEGAAERQGFEPWKPLRVHRFSKPSESRLVRRTSCSCGVSATSCNASRGKTSSRRVTSGGTRARPLCSEPERVALKYAPPSFANLTLQLNNGGPSSAPTLSYRPSAVAESPRLTLRAGQHHTGCSLGLGELGFGPLGSAHRRDRVRLTGVSPPQTKANARLQRRTTDCLHTSGSTYPMRRPTHGRPVMRARTVRIADDRLLRTLNLRERSLASSRSNRCTGSWP